ncbi:MAG: hypothetical protein V3S60_05575 [Acidimicrobiia bacterium]
MPCSGAEPGAPNGNAGVTASRHDVESLDVLETIYRANKSMLARPTVMRS